MDNKLIRLLFIISLIFLATIAAVLMLTKKIENNNLLNQEKTIIIENQVQLNSESPFVNENKKEPDIERELPLSGPLLN